MSVPTDTPKHAQTFLEKDYANLGKILLTNKRNINMNNDIYIIDTKEQYQNDIKNIKDEIIVIKETIVFMQN